VDLQNTSWGTFPNFIFSVTSWIYTNSTDNSFTVSNLTGKVNNLGTINWECEKMLKIQYTTIVNMDK